VGTYQKDERSVSSQGHETINDFLLPSEKMQKGLILIRERHWPTPAALVAVLLWAHRIWPGV
jgi:hypothetical protein